MTPDLRILRGLCAATVVALGLPAPASANAVTAIDTFMILRTPTAGAPGINCNGQAAFYCDTFSDGAESPAGGQFFNGATGSYGVLGSYPAGAEAAGRLSLDSALGGPFVNAAGGGRSLQRSVLLTDANPASPAGLKQGLHTFGVYGVFDLTLPPAIGDGYGILINDSGPGGGTSSIDLLLRHDEDGNVVIRLQLQDFIQHQILTLERDLLIVPDGADQIEFRLQRADLATNTISAAYRFIDGSQASAFIEMQATVPFFQHTSWARGGFFATQKIPEPGMLALLGLALAAGMALPAARQRVRGNDRDRGQRTALIERGPS